VDNTPTEYFKDLVETALSRQQLRANDLTSYYLVDLLCRFVRPDRRIPFSDDSNEPLALRLGRALGSDGLEQRARLRNLGDFSLFMSGFFPDSFHRKVVDVDYYVSMGAYAYGSLSRRDADAFGEVFAELARKFVAYMDVLSDVSEQSGIRSSMDVLRLYEKWLRTGSPRDGQRLIDRGILPNSSIGAKFVQ
jgi:hypothetical protein